MKAHEFQELFETFRSTAFRLETLSRYIVDDYEPDVEAYIAGKPFPQNKNEDWCSLVAGAVASGRQMSRVHILPTELTPYLRYEIEWGYTYNYAAGERIYLLLSDETFAKHSLALQDFWIFDDKVLVLMKYDSTGRYEGAERVDEVSKVSEFIRIRDLLLERSVDLCEFLARYRRGEMIP